MKIDLNVNVHHLTRVEGHGNIRVSVENGRIKEARWDIIETPRYFEVMLKGKHYTSAGILTSRICGICSIGHCLASVRATERAFGVTVPETAAKLRLLAKHGETLQSHYLHLFFLAAPDFLSLPSAIPLIEQNPAVVGIACRLKGLANRICDVAAGRTTHPTAIHVGGVNAVPSKSALLELRDALIRSLEDAASTAELFKTFAIPDFERETEFVSLQGTDEYPFIGGSMVSTDGVVHAEDEYLQMTNEYVDDNNTSKWTRLSRTSFAVGALARFNNNSRLLHPEASKLASYLRLTPVCHNPFMNNVAQLVECVHCTYDSIRLVDEILESHDSETMTSIIPRAGDGVGAVEVPRGILYHHYSYGEDGRIIRANCVIPTTQNNANIHHDLRTLVEKFAQEGTKDEKIELLCSMLVRAYDPCISCSVH